MSGPGTRPARRWAARGPSPCENSVFFYYSFPNSAGGGTPPEQCHARRPDARMRRRFRAPERRRGHRAGLAGPSSDVPPLRLKILCTLGDREVSVQDIVDQVARRRATSRSTLRSCAHKGILTPARTPTASFTRWVTSAPALIGMMRQVFCSATRPLPAIALSCLRRSAPRRRSGSLADRNHGPDSSIRRQPPGVVIALVVVLTLLIQNLIGGGGGRDAVDPVRATELINHENAVVVDVRPMADFDQGHIIGAINIRARLRQPAQAARAPQEQADHRQLPSGAQSPRPARRCVRPGREGPQPARRHPRLAEREPPRDPQSDHPPARETPA